MSGGDLHLPVSGSSFAVHLFAFIERACWLLGGLLILLCVGAMWDASHGRRAAIEQFHRSVATISPPIDSALPIGTHLWSAARVSEYRRALALTAAPPVAVLRIQRVALEVPVFVDSRDLHLNRGAGLIAGMQPPGVGGNLGIAGHRDGFFRVLKDVRVRDQIEVQTRERLFIYRIVAIDVVGANDTSVLADTSDPTITLVTCYPFYFVGHAPQRFIVRGTLERASANSSLSVT